MWQSLVTALGGASRHPEEVALKSYFSSINPTFGTGVASLDGATAYDATKGLIYLYNGDTTGKVRVMLDYIYLRATAVNTSATSFHFAFTKDRGNRYSSGGAAMTIVNMLDSTLANVTKLTSKVTIAYFGDVVLTTATAGSVQSWREQVRDVIFAADDTLHMTFGEGQMGTHGATTSGTSKAVRLPPMIINPGESLLISELAPSQAADPAFEYAIGWVELPKP